MTPSRVSTWIDPAHDNRLTYDDDLFLRSRRALGISVVNQVVWRFTEPVAEAELQRLRAGLTGGRLARAVHPSRWPGARDRWVRNGVPGDLQDHGIVPAAEIAAWAERVAAVDLDPVGGAGYRIDHAALSDGGHVVSYLISHVVADGGGLIAAVGEALGEADSPRLPCDDPSALTPGHRGDLADGWAQIRAAAKGLTRKVPAAPPRTGRTSADTPVPDTADDDDLPWTPATAVVDVPAAAWEEAARAAGGTANTLLVAVTTEVLLASGREAPGATVRAATPVSMRRPGDLRANASAGVSFPVETTTDAAGHPQVADLAAIRAASKREFATLSDGSRLDPLERFKPLLQMLPDAALRPLARNQPAPLCLASNLGVLDQSFAEPFGLAPQTVVMRSLTQGVTRGSLRRTRAGVASWWCRHGDTATLSMTGLDPDHFPDREQLTAWVLQVLQRRGLSGRAW